MMTRSWLPPMFNPWQRNAGLELLMTYPPIPDAQCETLFATFDRAHPEITDPVTKLRAFDALFPGRCSTWAQTRIAQASLPAGKRRVAETLDALPHTEKREDSLPAGKQRVAEKLGALPQTDDDCAVAFLAFRTANAEKYPQLVDAFNAFGALSPTCASWVVARITELRSATYSTETDGNVTIRAWDDTTCAEAWNTFAAAINNPPYRQASRLVQQAAQADFRSRFSGCASWVDGGGPDRATAAAIAAETPPPAATSSGFGGGLMIAAVVAAALLAGSGKAKL